MNGWVFPEHLCGALIADPYSKQRTGIHHMDEDTPQILVPIDFSSDSQLALEYAVGLARRQSSEIVLIHVVESLPHGVYQWCDPSDLHDQLAKNAKRHLECFERRALDLYPHCRSEVHFGAPAQAIAARAITLNAKMIVVSVRRRTGIFDRLLEGLPEKLLRLAPCPVLAVQSAASDRPHTSASSQHQDTLTRLHL